jgi:sugar diacid utilization regulator
VVRADAVLDDAEVRLVERGAMGIALTLVRDRAIDEATIRNRGEILSALLERGDTDTGTLHRRAAAANVDLSREHLLAVVKFEDREARDVCVDLARKDGLMAERAGRTILLVPATKSLKALAAHATIGRCAVKNGVAAVPGAYAAARQVLHALLALGRHHLDADTDAVGIYRFLIPGDPAGGTAEFIHRTAGPLLDYDRKHRSDLAGTILEYLVPGRSHKATAEILHIHPNTLTQRLDRVNAILSGWSDPDKAIDLQVALKLHRLAGTLGDDRRTAPPGS